MAETDGNPYDKARDLAEAALGEYAHGNAKKGDKLAQQAVQTDRHAVEELVQDLDEDAKATGAGDAESSGKEPA